MSKICCVAALGVDVQLAAVCDEYSKHSNCVFIACLCGSLIQHHFQQTTVFRKENGKKNKKNPTVLYKKTQLICAANQLKA